MKSIFILLATGLCLWGNAQQSVDQSFTFQGTSKKYSLYIPSGYQSSTPAKMMLGMHPFNTNRWDAEAWRDTLTDFAEANQLLLVCPDGGPDGNILDPIDTAFTSALLDSVHQWYSIDSQNQYIMGFSRGGQATYVYGLDNAPRFGGYIVIGAAASASDLTNPRRANADGEPFAILHGSGDAPGFRFTPLRDALQSNNAVVWDTLMPNVGHTIDFTNRNALLTQAFQFVDSVNNYVAPQPTSVQDAEQQGTIRFWPNPVFDQLNVEDLTNSPKQVVIRDLQGRIVYDNTPTGSIQIDTSDWTPGTYRLQVGDQVFSLLKMD
ncbi:T9SS type A sorting domain-containing protein [bacterium SCSIO 12741]|nr:T9SS type A sorting domain-containing protein [bacterium SCSIO 12741]